MRNMTKILACLLALLMLLPLAVACNKEEQPGEESGTSGSTGDVADETPSKPKETDKWGQEIIDNTALRDLDFNGETVNILVRNGQQYQREWFTKEPADALEQEIYYRNLAIEEEINVRLNYIPTSEGDANATFTTAVKNAGEAADGSVDIVSNFAAYASNTTLISLYKDWYSDDLTYLNLENPYWNQSFIENAEAFDRLFLCVGDVNLSVYDRAMVVFFNRNLVENVYHERIGDLYQLVLDGGWTSEVLYTMIKDLHEDNGTPEDESDDIYGLASIRGSEASDGFLYSWDAWLTEKNADGTHQLVTEGNRVKLSNAFDQMTKIWYGSNGAKMLGNSGDNYTFFTQGHAVFDIDVLYHYKSGWQMLNEMKDGFGIVPVPKYDTDQEDYYTGIQDAHNVMSIVNNGMKSNFDLISAVLELLCAENYATVRPSYIETNVKGQFLDAKSGACFEMVLNGTRWDFADVYAASTGYIRNALWRSPFKNFETGTSFTNAIQSNESKMNGDLADMDRWLVSNY